MPQQQNEQPIVITSVGQSPEQELRGRQIQYALLMGLRVVCFLTAVIVPIVWIRIIAVAAAFVLPWVGVVGANAVRERMLHGSDGYVAEPRNSLPPAQR